MTGGTDTETPAGWPADDWWRPGPVELTDGTRLAVRTTPGGDRPVLLVHGLASNALLWRDVAEALAAKGHAVAAIDLRGHGLSERPAEGHSTAQAARDLVVVVNALGWRDRSPLVAGQSWGGNVALNSVAIDPLWAGVACVDGGWIYLRDRFASFEECWEVLAPPAFGNASPDEVLHRIQDGLRGWPSHAPAAVFGNLEVVEGRVRNRLARDLHREIVRSLWQDDPALTYPRVHTPVHLMVAGRSSSPDVDKASAMLESATVSWHPDAHHDIHLQYPEVVTEQIFGLLERVQGSTR